MSVPMLNTRYERQHSALFMPDMSGLWTCIVSNTDHVKVGDVLADVCSRYEIDAPPALEFARWRFIGLTIELRAAARRVQLTFYNPKN